MSGRLKAARVLRNLGYHQVAWRLRLSTEAVKKKEDGDRGIATDEIAAWAKFSRCSSEWLITGKGKAPPGLERIDHIGLDGTLHRRHRPTELERAMKC
jgi:hypothetical protein